MTDCYTVRKQSLSAIATYALECAQKKETQELACTQHEDQGKYICTQERDDGYNDCGDWGTKASSECASWSKNCCTWWPCNKICEFFTLVCNGYVTVVTAVCNALVWVKNIVCLAEVWFNNWVCVASAWVTNVTCLAWHWVVKNVRIVVAEITYVLCMIPKWIGGALNAFEWTIISTIRCMRGKDQPRNPIEKPGWRLVFADDFDSGQLERWWKDHSYTGKRFDDENPAPQTYADPANIEFGTSVVRLKVDNVPITVPHANYPGGSVDIPYTIGWINWEPDYTPDMKYGYFEMRCKIPNSPEMWPAFWMIPRHPWPPEIDIFEFYTGPSNDDMFFESSVHWGTDPKKTGHPKQTVRHRVCQASKFFHIYACEWKEGEARFFIDNNLVRVATEGMSDFVYPMFVIVSTGLDSRTGHTPANGTYPNYLEVDYVRAYSKV